MSGGGAGPGAQIFNIGKSKAQLFDQNTNVKITFKNVAGLEGAKEEVQEVVSFLKDPDRYTSLGGKIPKGALLVKILILQTLKIIKKRLVLMCFRENHRFRSKGSSGLKKMPPMIPKLSQNLPQINKK